VGQLGGTPRQRELQTKAASCSSSSAHHAPDTGTGKGIDMGPLQSRACEVHQRPIVIADTSSDSDGGSNSGSEKGEGGFDWGEGGEDRDGRGASHRQAREPQEEEGENEEDKGYLDDRRNSDGGDGSIMYNIGRSSGDDDEQGMYAVGDDGYDYYSNGAGDFDYDDADEEERGDGGGQEEDEWEGATELTPDERRCRQSHTTPSDAVVTYDLVGDDGTNCVYCVCA
jgi:hypothetical protein